MVREGSHPSPRRSSDDSRCLQQACPWRVLQCRIRGVGRTANIARRHAPAPLRRINAAGGPVQLRMGPARLPPRPPGLRENPGAVGRPAAAWPPCSDAISTTFGAECSTCWATGDRCHRPCLAHTSRRCLRCGLTGRPLRLRSGGRQRRRPGVWRKAAPACQARTRSGRPAGGLHAPASWCHAQITDPDVPCSGARGCVGPWARGPVGPLTLAEPGAPLAARAAGQRCRPACVVGVTHCAGRISRHRGHGACRRTAIQEPPPDGPF